MVLKIILMMIIVKITTNKKNNNNNAPPPLGLMGVHRGKKQMRTTMSFEGLEFF